MTLCLAESLIECGGFDAADQMRRYVRWYRGGHLSSTARCFDIGNTTRAALERFEATGDPWCGSNDPFTVHCRQRINHAARACRARLRDLAH
jgi:ADP-ribosyl-[dinitrogen reductase] hydrolase